MPSTKGFHDYVMHDLFVDMRGMSSRAMFGGYGLYKNGTIFGIIVDDALYFKADAAGSVEYTKRGSRPFVYKAHSGKSVAMSYWQVPEEIVEDRVALTQWIAQAFAISVKSKKK